MERSSDRSSMHKARVRKRNAAYQYGGQSINRASFTVLYEVIYIKNDQFTKWVYKEIGEVRYGRAAVRSPFPFVTGRARTPAVPAEEVGRKLSGIREQRPSVPFTLRRRHVLKQCGQRVRKSLRWTGTSRPVR